jgi:hypothetical protein
MYKSQKQSLWSQFTSVETQPGCKRPFQLKCNPNGHGYAYHKKLEHVQPDVRKAVFLTRSAGGLVACGDLLVTEMLQ